MTRGALVRWLEGLDARELGEVLRRRPDALTSPPPGDLTQLAARLSTRTAVADVLATLPLPALQVLSALGRLGPAPVDRSRLASALRVDAADPQLDATLRVLAQRALVWPDGSDLWVVPYVSDFSDFSGPFEPVPPAPALVPADRPVVRAATADAAVAALHHTSALLATAADHPLARQRNGGVATRELARLASALDLDEALVAHFADVVLQAGLLGPDGAHLRPTTAYAEWVDAPPADQLARLLSSWWSGPALRRVVVRALHDLPPDTALAGAETLAPLVRWIAPLASLAAGADLTWTVSGLLAEAALLGICPLLDIRAPLTSAPDEPTGLAGLTLVSSTDAAPDSSTDAATDSSMDAAPDADVEPSGRAGLSLVDSTDLAPDAELAPGAGIHTGSEPNGRRGLTLVRSTDSAPDDAEPNTAARTPHGRTAAGDGAGHRPTGPHGLKATDRGRSGHGRPAHDPGDGDSAVTRGAADPSAEPADRGPAADSAMAGAAVFAISPLGRALADGRSVAEVAAHLLPGPPPPDPLRVRDAGSVVLSDDPDLLDEVVAELGLERLAPTVAASRDAAAETLAALRSAGYRPETDGPRVTLRRDGTPRRTPAPLGAPPAARPARTKPTADPTELARRLVVPLPRHASPLEQIQRRAPQLRPEQAQLLADAVEHGSPVWIRYVDANGRASERVIENAELAGSVIEAWCRLRRDDRAFTLDKIVAVARPRH